MSKSGIGFLTIAQNTQHVDYLTLAYVQAMNVKLTQDHAKYAVIVDDTTLQHVTDKHRQVFDHIIKLPYDENEDNCDWKLGNEYQVFELTPFKETIKVEADLLFTRSIMHWMNAFRLKDVFLSYGCKNYRQELSDIRSNRKLFDENDLPDVYSGLMYFRYSKFASLFFQTAKTIYQNWDDIKTDLLKNCREDTPSTDVLYALTAKVLGQDLCCIPSMNFVNFIHMKNNINRFGNDTADWHEIVFSERDNDMIRINNINQIDPVHYHSKSYINKEIVDYYEQRFFRS